MHLLIDFKFYVNIHIYYSLKVFGDNSSQGSIIAVRYNNKHIKLKFIQFRVVFLIYFPFDFFNNLTYTRFVEKYVLMNL